ASHAPKKLLVLNNSTYTKPEITGATEKGRSINVISNRFPAKSNLVIAQDAAIPKTILRGTAIAATSKVRRIAATASGLLKASAEAAKPPLNDSIKTTARDNKTSTKIKSDATPIRSRRSHNESKDGDCLLI